MRASLLLSLALVGLACGTPVAKPKGVTVFKGTEGRIVGGVEATPHEFPWIVDMRRGSHYCAGSIISPEWVVTAAHCSQAAPSGYTLTAGDHNINNQDGREQTRQVVQIINHPQYGSPLQYENDIALMKVEPPFEFNEWVSAVIIPDVNFAPTPMAVVTGWGALTEGGSSPSQLMKVDVPYVDDDTCNQRYGGSVADSMICYGEAGKDSCQGDSGGPIMCGGDNDTLVLCGIVSWGQGCARPNYPGVYTETSYYGEWIRTATVPTAEDPEPVTTIETCGGYVETSSGTMNFMPGSNVPAGTKCLWTVKTPYDALRVRLTASGLTDADGLFVTRYDASNGAPGAQTQISTVNMDYNMNGGMVLVTLAVEGTSSQGISLNFFSSGFGDSSPALTGFASLNATSGTYRYPQSGEYRNGESALMILSPQDGADKTLTFTGMDVEDGCQYDAVSVWSWTNNRFTQLAEFCGTSLPGPFQLPGGVGLVTFTTDSSVTGAGFTFNWA